MDKEEVREMSEKFDLKVKLEDISQLSIGATALAIPVAMTEDTWNLSKELPWLNTISIFVVTLLVIGFYVHFKYVTKSTDSFSWHFFVRVLVAYAITAIASATVLFLFQRLPLDDPQIAITRIVLVTFPAGFVATIVDSWH